MHRLFNHLIVIRDAINIIVLTVNSKLLVVQLKLIPTALAIQFIIDVNVLLLRKAILSC
jgi:hypothetical protein